LSTGFVAFDDSLGVFGYLFGLSTWDHDDIFRLLCKGKEEVLDRLDDGGYAGIVKAIEPLRDI